VLIGVPPSDIHAIPLVIISISKVGIIFTITHLESQVLEQKILAQRMALLSDPALELHQAV